MLSKFVPISAKYIINMYIFFSILIEYINNMVNLLLKPCILIQGLYIVKLKVIMSGHLTFTMLTLLITFETILYLCQKRDRG